MIRKCWILLFAFVWTIGAFFVAQYWSTLLIIGKQVINWNDFVTNSTVQTTSFIFTKQLTSSNISRNSSSTITRDFKAILNLNASSNASTSPLLTMNSKSNISTGKNLQNSENTTSSSNRFIYLVQTGRCLAEHLLQPGLFGDGCENDILVLSWKQPCTLHFSEKLKHIMYIYKADTTWSSGRNILYNVAKKIPKIYLYYIFMDDDLSFNFTSSAFQERYRNLGIRWPLQAFEDFLLKHEPAIGMPLFCWRSYSFNKITRKLETINEFLCDRVKRLKPLPDYLPVTVHFDAAFNAFHKNAIGHILPYRLDYEQHSWWQSQKFVILASELVFRGQVLRFFPVTVLNEQHREYPRANWDNWSNIYNILIAEMPRIYRPHVNWTPDHNTVDVLPSVRNNTVITPMWNVEIPSGKIAVEPFKHFNV